MAALIHQLFLLHSLHSLDGTRVRSTLECPLKGIAKATTAGKQGIMQQAMFKTGMYLCGILRMIPALQVGSER